MAITSCEGSDTLACSTNAAGDACNLQPPPTLASVAQQAGKRHRATLNQTLDEIFQMFQVDPQCCGVMVMDGQRCLAVLSRETTAQQLSKPYARELFLNKPLHQVLPHWPIAALVLPQEMLLAAAIETALSRLPQYRFEPVIIITQNDERVLVDIHSILIAQCRALTTALAELEQQRQATAAAEREREQLHQRLLVASRDAGRAEIATGVLHNVGNVLNSMNASTGLISRRLQQSKLENLGRAVGLLNEHQNDLPSFLSNDEKGKALPGYLGKLASVLSEEHSSIAEEMACMGRSLEHIKQIVQMQQRHARAGNVLEPVAPAELMEDAIHSMLPSFDRHNVHIVRQFQNVPPQPLDRHKVLQVLINLISNAKNAVKVNAGKPKEITLSISLSDDDGPQRLVYAISDNGVGIPHENLARIFAHGFTTRKEGHGFGLHCSANAAREMGGSIVADSQGIGLGATFRLELPAQRVEART